MSELARKPSTLKKVQDEVRSVVGAKSKIEEHDITKMEYFRCAIKETLRLHSVSTLARVSSSPVNIGGYQLPTKATVLINSWAIQRDPDIWDQPLEFLPERFKDSVMGYKGQDVEYFPFGLGRRICPGAQFAVTEVEFTMANLLCWFDWRLPDGITPETLDMSDTFAQVPSKKMPLQLVPTPAQQTDR